MAGSTCWRIRRTTPASWRSRRRAMTARWASRRASILKTPPRTLIWMARRRRKPQTRRRPAARRRRTTSMLKRIWCRAWCRSRNCSCCPRPAAALPLRRVWGRIRRVTCSPTSSRSSSRRRLRPSEVSSPSSRPGLQASNRTTRPPISAPALTSALPLA